MRVFLTGASGYIGSAVACRLLSDGWEVRGLVRNPVKAQAIAALGMVPIIGSLDDDAILREQALAADAVINTADSDHRRAAETLVGVLEGSGKPLLHTSGSSIISDEARGEPASRIYDEDEPIVPSPRRAPRVSIDRLVREARGVRSVVLCNGLVYGNAIGLPAESAFIAIMARYAVETGRAWHVGRGLNRWSNVHVSDLADLYTIALSAAQAGSFLYVESGEEEMRAVAQAIAGHFGLGAPEAADRDRAERAWGERLANYSLGSNSRVRGRLGRELGWRPRQQPIVDWIRHANSHVFKRDR